MEGLPERFKVSNFFFDSKDDLARNLATLRRTALSHLQYQNSPSFWWKILLGRIRTKPFPHPITLKKWKHKLNIVPHRVIFAL